MTNTINEREIALDILMEVNEKEQYIHVLLNDALRKYQYLEKNERAFISRLVKDEAAHKKSHAYERLSDDVYGAGSGECGMQ